MARTALFKLSRQKTQKNEESGDAQKFYIKSSLANSLIGQLEGDIVKVGNLDNFVEILRTLN